MIRILNQQIQEKKSELLKSHEHSPQRISVNREKTETFNTQHTPTGSKMNDDDYSAINLGSDFDDSEELTPLSS